MTKEEAIQKQIEILRNHPNLDEPYNICMSSYGSQAKSCREVMESLENRTPDGLDIIKTLESLNEDLIKRGKKPIWNE